MTESPSYILILILSTNLQKLQKATVLKDLSFYTKTLLRPTRFFSPLVASIIKSGDDPSP